MSTLTHETWAAALFEAIDDAVFVHDLEGHILDANPAACRRLGYTRDELLRLRTRDIDALEFAGGFADRLKAQLRHGQLRCEGKHRTKDGRIIPVDINSSTIQLDGRPAILAVMRDITQRKEVEERLARQSQLLQSILDNMGDAVVVADARGRLLVFNPAALRLFGWPGQDLDFFARSLFRPDKTTPLPRADWPFERAIRGEEFDEVEIFVRNDQAPQGSWVSAAGRPLRNDSGGIQGGVVVCRDITASQRAALEHQRVEKALRDSEAMYHSLVESLPQNIFRKDRQGRVTFGNERYCATLKRPLAELLGKTDFDLFPAELAAKYVGDDQRVLETGATFETIERHHLPDGADLYVQVVKTPVYDAQGHIVGTQGIFWDVTEPHRAAELLANSERRYRQLTEATLDAIVLADAGRRIVLFNPAAERMFGFQAAEILGQAVDLLLPQHYRPLHQRGFERFLETRQPRILGRTVELSARRKDGSEFPVEIALSAFAPSASLETAPADSLQFLAAFRDLTERNQMRQQVLLNLLLNAFQAIEAKGKEGGRILIRTRRRDHEFFIEVHDNGCGIEPQHLPKLFDPFFTTKDVGEGTGLGLSITHNIVTAHGGRIQVDSQPGQGACFQVFLPVKGE